MRLKIISSCLVVASLFAGCTTKPVSSPEQSTTSSESSGLLESSTDPVEFRNRFISSHTLLLSCSGFPYLAVTGDGDYLASKTQYLGRTINDWTPIFKNKEFLIGDYYYLLQEKSNIPVIIRSNLPIAPDGVLQPTSTSKACALLRDPSIASTLIDEWYPRYESDVNKEASINLIQEQRSIDQPVLASWDFSPEEKDDGEVVFTSVNRNLDKGISAYNGYYTTASGTHKIWTACRDIFNPTAEKSCSGDVIIKID